ncbi:nitroreductase/quinone reductase family protein [Actinoplanes sp. Pm04-4]|uniref:Nitroreductase/quinone reductase family protein n=1 Tax=Paractinoplanes pyxinae TaxID=2997416 RepID=A0ABT4AX56_9ACTN|nr:nitroreductase/quinone reductase family protein [Actinoplanes pyxinae]MCY1138447.1 nitroreductase/quinone reductase family protein [Actinoplanes pyxinae]
MVDPSTYGFAEAGIAANFGETRHPAWYHNLKAHPYATTARPAPTPPSS